MGLIIEEKNLRNPEDMALDLFQMSGQPSEKEEPHQLFFLKVAVITLIVMILKVGSYQAVPGLYELGFALGVSAVMSLCCVGLAAGLQKLMRHGLPGIGVLLMASILLFIAIEWLI